MTQKKNYFAERDSKVRASKMIWTSITIKADFTHNHFVLILPSK